MYQQAYLHLIPISWRSRLGSQVVWVQGTVQPHVQGMAAHAPFSSNTMIMDVCWAPALFCRKNKVVPAQIHEIQAVMLDNLAASRSITGTTGPTAAAADGTAAAAVPTGVVDTAFYSAMGMQQYLQQGTHPRDQAEELLLQMASFTQDIAMVGNMLDSSLGSHWFWVFATHNCAAAHCCDAAACGGSSTRCRLQQLGAMPHTQVAFCQYAVAAHVPCCAVLVLCCIVLCYAVRVCACAG